MVQEEEKQVISSVHSSLRVNAAGWYAQVQIAWLFALSEGRLGLHGVAQFGGILGVTLAVNQHQWIPLVVLDDVGDAGEMLLPSLLSSQSILLSRGYKADRDVVHSALVKHH